MWQPRPALIGGRREPLQLSRIKSRSVSRSTYRIAHAQVPIIRARYGSSSHSQADPTCVWYVVSRLQSADCRTSLVASTSGRDHEVLCKNASSQQDWGHANSSAARQKIIRKSQLLTGLPDLGIDGCIRCMYLLWSRCKGIKVCRWSKRSQWHILPQGHLFKSWNFAVWFLLGLQYHWVCWGSKCNLLREACLSEWAGACGLRSLQRSWMPGYTYHLSWPPHFHIFLAYTGYQEQGIEGGHIDGKENMIGREWTACLCRARTLDAYLACSVVHAVCFQEKWQIISNKSEYDPKFV